MPTLKKIVVAGILPYALLLPENFDSTKSYPLGTFLHGLGERGTDLDKMVNAWGPIKSLTAGKAKADMIWLQPLLPLSIGNWSYDLVAPVLAHVLASYKINRAKFYLSGLSLGGGGCDYTLNVQPDLFTAVAALSPSKGFDATIAGKVTGAYWYWHNLNDTTCSPTYSINSVVALWNAKGWEGTKNTILYSKPAGLQTATLTPDLQIKWTAGAIPGGLTLNDTGGHGGWQSVYDSQAFYDWLLSLTKGTVQKYISIGDPKIDVTKIDTGSQVINLVYNNVVVGTLPVVVS